MKSYTLGWFPMAWDSPICWPHNNHWWLDDHSSLPNFEHFLHDHIIVLTIIVLMILVTFCHLVLWTSEEWYYEAAGSGYFYQVMGNLPSVPKCWGLQGTYCMSIRFCGSCISAFSCGSLPVCPSINLNHEPRPCSKLQLSKPDAATSRPWPAAMQLPVFCRRRTLGGCPWSRRWSIRTSVILLWSR